MQVPVISQNQFGWISPVIIFIQKPIHIGANRCPVILKSDIFTQQSIIIPNPFGKRFEVEFSNTRLLFNAEAFKKIIRAKYSITSLVLVSITLTPVALPFFHHK